MQGVKPEDKHTIERWLEKERGRPQARAMRSAGYAVNRIVRPLSKSHGGKSTVATIAADWPAYAGRFAKLSRPVRLSGGKAGATLMIETRGSVGGLIQADAANIIARINARLGAGTVRAIRTLHGQSAARPDTPAGTQPAATRGLTPTEEAQLHQALSDTPDGPLKAALEKLGRSVMSRGIPKG